MVIIFLIDCVLVLLIVVCLASRGLSREVSQVGSDMVDLWRQR